MLKKLAIIIGVIGLFICCVNMENTWGDTSLPNGLVLNGSVSQGQEIYYTISVPSGPTRLEVNLYNLSNDADLYVRYNSKPTTSSYDSTSNQYGTVAEACNFNNPASGTWYIMVRGFSSGATSYTIKATFFNSGPLVVDFGATGSLTLGTPLGNGPGLIFKTANGHRRDLCSWIGGMYIGSSSNSDPAPIQLMMLENGNVGIGTDSPSYKLHVIGDIAHTGGCFTPSDVRLKENITSLTNAIDKVSALRGIYFNLEGESPSKREVGVIAQEVESVLPEAVSEDARGYKSVDYSKLTPLLIEAVKELKAQNEDLKTSVGKLQARIEAL